MGGATYGIVELRAEHGPTVVRILGVHDLLPGTMVEIRPVDDPPTVKRDDKPAPLPEVRGMVLA